MKLVLFQVILTGMIAILSITLGRATTRLEDEIRRLEILNSVTNEAAIMREERLRDILEERIGTLENDVNTINYFLIPRK